MKISRSMVERTRVLVDNCGLDTLSIFFRDFNCPATPLTYVHHHGVSPEAEAIYRDQRVFEDDPFTRISARDDRGGSLIRWEDDRVTNAAASAGRYREFINCHDVNVVAAWVQQIMPGFLMVIGTHCRSDGHARSEVGQRLLEAEIAQLSHVVIGELLETVLDSLGGASRLGFVLHPEAEADRPADPLDLLTPREAEIARLVGAGQLNKQVAGQLGISEYTVENHLRRVYSKLGIHNRATLAACLVSPTRLH